jgi:CubicO group peptidase (beta-lactamase class C family)
MWSCQEPPQIKPNKTLHIIESVDSTNLPIVSMPEIDGYFRELNRHGIFNGNVLIARKGKVIYRQSYGISNFETKTPLELNTIFQIGSVSKQFTAVAVLQLVEQGKVKLDQDIRDFIPELPYKGITVHHLLCHKSGMVNYIYFCENSDFDRSKSLTNNDVIHCFAKERPIAYYPPNRRFDYSNTGYLLLATMVERVSAQKFPDYLKSHIFEPLGMKTAFVYNHSNRFRPESTAKGYEFGTRTEAIPDYLDGVVGDKGVYATVNDLMLWDQGLYTNKIIQKKTLDLAFLPHGKAKNAHSNYGYGWRMYTRDNKQKVLYHAGWWHGYQALLVRSEVDSTTIVVLKNVRNRSAILQNKLLEIVEQYKD